MSLETFTLSYTSSGFNICLFFILPRYLLVEFPICILITSILFLIENIQRKQSKFPDETVIFFLLSLLSLYMVKKPLIALFPAAFYILWIQGYKKQILYF